MLSYQLHWSYFHQQHESNELVGFCTWENFRILVAFCITTEFIEHPLMAGGNFFSPINTTSSCKLYILQVQQPMQHSKMDVKVDIDFKFDNLYQEHEATE